MFDDFKDLRLLSFLGVLGLTLAAVATLFFWGLGAFNLVMPGGYGQIAQIGLSGLPYVAYLAFPALVVIFSFAGWLAFFDHKEMLALTLTALPLGVLMLVYIYLTSGRQWLL